MNRNLKILDRYDRQGNIYELISSLSGRTHAIIGGTPSSVETRGKSIVQVAMDEKLVDESEKGET